MACSLCSHVYLMVPPQFVYVFHGLLMNSFSLFSFCCACCGKPFIAAPSLQMVWKQLTRVFRPPRFSPFWSAWNFWWKIFLFGSNNSIAQPQYPVALAEKPEHEKKGRQERIVLGHEESAAMQTLEVGVKNVKESSHGKKPKYKLYRNIPKTTHYELTDSKGCLRGIEDAPGRSKSGRHPAERYAVPLYYDTLRLSWNFQHHHDVFGIVLYVPKAWLCCLRGPRLHNAARPLELEGLEGKLVRRVFCRKIPCILS